MLLGAFSCAIPKEFRAHSEFVQREVLENDAIKADGFELDGTLLSYRYSGNAERAIVLWIHGTPGSWSDIGRLLVDRPFLQQVKLVSVDRPGWGASQNRDADRVYPGFDQQSRFLSPLILRLKQQYPNTPLIIAGHSWGGSLAPAVAAENPQQVDAVLILAGGLDPDLTRPRWYNRLAKIWPINALIGSGLRQSNIEMYALADNLAALQSDWPQLATMPMIVVQGGKDPLVSPRNADYAQSVIDGFAQANADGASPLQKVVNKPEMGHLLHIKHTDLIKDCLFDLLAELDQKKGQRETAQSYANKKEAQKNSRCS